MQDLQKHSIYGYFTRLPTNKLEQVLETQHSNADNNLLQPEDYSFIRRILQSRSDSRLFIKEQVQDANESGRVTQIATPVCALVRNDVEKRK